MKGVLALDDGGHLAYETIGNGPPLLLVSGLGGLASFWGDFAKACAEHFTVVMHDHRGTGASSRCDREYSIASMADDVAALSRHLGLERPAYVGHSTGGAIGQHLAATGALDFRALVLSATFARPCAYFRRLFTSRLQVLEAMGLEAYREQATLLLYPPYWLAEHEVGAGRSNGSSHVLDAEITRRRIEAVMAHDALDRLPQIQCPTLVIVAADDIVTPPYHSLQLADALPKAEVVVLPRGGHYIVHTESDAYRRDVLTFLQRHT